MENELTRQVQALQTDEDWNVSGAAVLDLVKNAVVVRVDEANHDRPPLNEHEKLTWAVLDTTWRLLREYSVRVTLLSIREQALEQGSETFPETDEELFAQAQAENGEDAPTGYLELASEDPTAAFALALLFQKISEQTYAEAAEALNSRTAFEEALENLLKGK
jgi:hypothetical protein